jgi:hypothetical protein
VEISEVALWKFFKYFKNQKYRLKRTLIFIDTWRVFNAFLNGNWCDGERWVGLNFHLKIINFKLMNRDFLKKKSIEIPYKPKSPFPLNAHSVTYKFMKIPKFMLLLCFVKLWSFNNRFQIFSKKIYEEMNERIWENSLGTGWFGFNLLIYDMTHEILLHFVENMELGNWKGLSIDW